MEHVNSGWRHPTTWLLAFVGAGLTVGWIHAVIQASDPIALVFDTAMGLLGVALLCYAALRKNRYMVTSDGLHIKTLRHSSLIAWPDIEKCMVAKPPRFVQAPSLWFGKGAIVWKGAGWGMYWYGERAGVALRLRTGILFLGANNPQALQEAIANRIDGIDEGR